MNKELLIPRNSLYIVIILGFVFNFFHLIFNLKSFGLSEDFIYIFISLAMLLSFVATAILIIDVFSNNVEGKYLWTLVFLFSGGFLGYFYLRNRTHFLTKKN